MMSRAAWVAVLAGLLVLGVCASQSLTDLAATLIFLTAIVVHVRRGPGGFWSRGETRALTALFAAWLAVLAAGLFLIAPPEAPREANLLEFRWMLELLLWIFLFRGQPTPGPRWLWIWSGLALSALYGIATVFIGTSPLHGNEIADRAGGFLNDPMSFAHVTGPVSLLLFGFLLQQRRPWTRETRATAALFALFLLATVLTFTRGVWAGVFIAALLLPLFSRFPRGWLLSLTGLVLCAGLGLGVPVIRDRLTQAFDPNRSYDGARIVLWRTNLLMFEDSPWVGLGYGENKRRLPEYYARTGVPEGQFRGHAHNQYLHWLAGTGALGLACYLVFIGFFLRLAWLGVRAADERLSGWALGLLGAQIAFHIAALTEANFSIAKNRYLLLLLLAATAVIAERAKTPPLRPPRS